MKKVVNPEAAILRQKAVKLLKKNQIQKKEQLNSEADMLKLIHELEVHQIELEMQNEELRKANEQAVIATDKYIELYDFAPSVFVTITSSGKIDRITLRGARMLGKERSLLFNYNFDFFVAEDSKPVFKEFMTKAFESRNHETCHIALKISGNSPIYVQIDAMASENGRQCHMSVIEISENIMKELNRSK